MAVLLRCMSQPSNPRHIDFVGLSAVGEKAGVGQAREIEGRHLLLLRRAEHGGSLSRGLTAKFLLHAI